MKKIIAVVVLLTLTSCGGGMFTKDSISPTVTEWGNALVTKDAFIFASDFPPDIVIPDIAEMRSTAFVISDSYPTGVLAIDLDTNPLTLSSKFKGVILPDGTGTPKDLHIMSATRAFLLTISHVIDFNPTTGTVNKALDLTGTYKLPEEFPLSGTWNGQTTTDEITYVVGEVLTVAADKLYIPMTNYIYYSPPVCAAGLVRVIEVLDGAPYIIESKDPIITTDFNPTSVAKVSEDTVAVVNSGVMEIRDAGAYPVTNASIDIINTSTNEMVENIPLGKTVPSLKGLAITSDFKAYIGSASIGQLYEIDLFEYEVLHGKDNPLTLTSNEEGSDYISSVAKSFDDSLLFAASFDHSSIYVTDISETEPVIFPEAFPDPIEIGLSKGVSSGNPTGGIMGLGNMAIRPGTPGEDFSGPDLFILTGSPGTIVTINTYGSMEGVESTIKSLSITPGYIKISTEETQALSVDVELSDGTIIENVTSTFTNELTNITNRVSWSSNNNSIASVTSEGILRANSEGAAIIYASVGEETAYISIYVAPSATPNISEDPEPAEEPADDPVDDPDPTPTGTGTSISIHDPNDVFRFIPQHLWGRIPGTVEEEVVGRWRRRHPASRFGGTEFTENPPEELEILTEAPAGTDPYIDKVISLDPGFYSGAGGFGESLPNPISDAFFYVYGAPSGTMDVISLGIGGEIVIEMTDFIPADGDGVDFTIFENPFFMSPGVPFSEPGVVSVSENGINWFSFSCDLDNEPYHPGCAGAEKVYALPGSGIDPTDPEVSGGDQFDLADVGIETARFIKITDAGVCKPGNICYSEGKGGFDLDAIAVVNGVVE